MEYNLRLLDTKELSSFSNNEQKTYLCTAFTDFASVLFKPHRNENYVNYLLKDAVIDTDLRISYISYCNGAYSSHSHVGCGFPLVMDIEDIDAYNKDITSVMIGEYPQRLVTRREGMLLEEAYQNKKLPILGQAFHTLTSKGINRKLVYEWNNQKYIRMTNNFSPTCKLKQKDRNFVIGDPLWFQILPVEWRIAREQNVLISKYCLLSCLPYEMVIKFLDCAVREDMFFLELMANEQLENNPRREEGVHKDLTYAIERMNLAKGVNPEVSSYLDSAIERLELASDKITTGYQKVKK